MQTIDN